MCPYEEKLTAWLLGDLSPEEQEAMARHLDGCATCRAMRDELASVLTPLKGGLAKDQRLRVPAAQRPRRRAPAFFHAPWVRAAALFLVSFGTLFALFGLFYNATTERKKPVGPVTTFTFHKHEQTLPPEPLEPFQPSVETADILSMAFEPQVLLPHIASIHVPEIPTREYTLPPFLTFAPLAMWASATNAPLIVYNDLLAQQSQAASATNTTDTTTLTPPPHINAYPWIR